MPTDNVINLIEVCEHWKDLPHQNDALDLLQKQTPPLVLDAFTEVWRSSPHPAGRVAARQRGSAAAAKPRKQPGISNPDPRVGGTPPE
ncbi:MAG: hypothetical protein HC910_22080 [Spirulinaceae cyanobacterium SM2_1_0]|nr:hypothetical protein [Spirulinaceae cyanobacterium SM2_1_0]